MAEIKLKIIGCGDAFSSGGNLQTCFYVEADNFRFLIDCGATSLTGLKKNNIDVSQLDLILITHLHGDHFSGLPFILLDTIQNPRKKELHIIGPKNMEEKSWDLFEMLYPGSIKSIQKDKIVFKSYDSEEEFSCGGIKVLAYPVIHTKETNPHGLRVMIEDKVISYSGDTEWCDNLIPLASDADLFICECTFFGKKVKGHLNYQTISSHLKLLGCKKILLTHLDEEMLNNRKNVDFPIAEDGMLLNI